MIHQAEQGPTSPTVSTLKRLFARSGNRCGFPQCRSAIVRAEAVIGEVCHIRGKNPGAARYDPTQTSLQRHDYENLILLCPTHHAIVDDNPETYTVDRLQKMKAEQEAGTAAISDGIAEHAARLLINRLVASTNQTGGITAGTVNINVNVQQPAVYDQQIERSTAGTLSDYTFVSNGGERIARTQSRAQDGGPNDFVYWHTGPTAWLRVIPSTPKVYGRAELLRLVQNTPFQLRPFGNGEFKCIHANDHGVVAIGFDGALPETIATRITQIFRTGEIWGHDKTLIDPQMNLSNTCRIPWPSIKEEFEDTLANYLQFAQHVLQLDLAITVVAGLALVKDAVFVRNKVKWHVEPPKTTHCLEQFVWRSATIRQFVTPPSQLLEPFYGAVFDACSLDYSEELQMHVWRREVR